MPRLSTKVDHDHLAAWVEHMKGVYQRVIDKHSASGKMEGSDIVKARNHIRALSMIQVLLTEHKEMESGAIRDFGRLGFQLETLASLIKPNGEVIRIIRRP